MILFGWLALYGWAGLLICGALVGATRPLVVSSSEGQASSREVWLRVSFMVHLAGLMMGGVGIVSQRDDWVRAAGVLVLIHGVELALGLLKSLRAPSPARIS